jgi:hypothetical protein
MAVSASSHAFLAIDVCWAAFTRCCVALLTQQLDVHDSCSSASRCASRHSGAATMYQMCCVHVYRPRPCGVLSSARPPSSEMHIGNASLPLLLRRSEYHLHSSCQRKLLGRTYLRVPPFVSVQHRGSWMRQRGARPGAVPLSAVNSLSEVIMELHCISYSSFSGCSWCSSTRRPRWCGNRIVSWPWRDAGLPNGSYADPLGC